MIEQVLEILKYVLPSVVVLVATVMIVNKFLVKEIERKQLAIFAQNSETTLKLRLQAYERLTIFVERMNAKSLISRYYIQQATAQDVQIAMVQGIRSEYEHNLSQQIYVSPQTWQMVRIAKEEMINIINIAYSQLGPNAVGFDLSKAVFQMIIEMESIPTQKALDFLRKEFHLIFD
jgi:hypothetical protein